MKHHQVFSLNQWHNCAGNLWCVPDNEQGVEFIQYLLWTAVNHMVLILHTQTNCDGESNPGSYPCLKGINDGAFSKFPNSDP